MGLEQRTGPGGAMERSRLLSSSRSNVVGALGETFREDTIWTAQDAQRSQRFRGVSPRRSDLGPVVSDRRWGTDVGFFEVPSNRIDTLCYELTGVLEEEIKAGTNFKREQQSKSIKGDKGEGKKSECVREDVEDQEMNDGPIAANSAGDHRPEEREDDADGADGTAGAESTAN